MRVLKILEDGRWGGPQKRVCAVSYALKDDVDIIIVTANYKATKLKSEVKRLGLNACFLEIRPLSSAFTKLQLIWHFFSDICTLRKTIVKSRPDLIHVCGGAWQFRSVLACVGLKPKIIWHLNDTNMPFGIRVIRSALSFLISHYICASKQTAEYYRIPRTKNSLVSAPAIVTTPPELKKYFKLEILVLGNINPNKRQDMAVDIACKLKQARIDFKMFIVGGVTDSHKSYFDSLVASVTKLDLAQRVIFDTNCSDPEAYHLACDVLLNCSKFESSPMSVWEGLRYGNLVCCTRAGEIGEVIVNSHNGFLFCEKSLDGLVSLLGSLKAGEKILNLRRNAMVAAMDKFSVEQVANLTLKQYEKVMTYDA